MAGPAVIYRLALTYDLAPDRALVPRDLPARQVIADREGALYRHLAALATAPDAEFAAAASRYGPLGPVRPLSIPDRALYVWAMGEQFRQYILGVGRLRHWIATGGQTPIPGRLAPSAHLIAAVAETDPVISQRLLDLFTEAGPPIASEAERERLARGFDVQEQAMLHAIGRREALLTRQAKKGDASVRVLPKPGTARYLSLASRYLRVLIRKAEEIGPAAALIPPDSLGRFATSIQPYIGENIIPTESVSAWREAAAELQTWTVILRTARSASQAEVSQAISLLTLRLQQVDAWPYPSGDQLGTFARALWTIWPRLTGHPPQRRCSWEGCSTLLPPDAHGNRQHCEAHRRERDRRRMADKRAKGPR